MKLNTLLPRIAAITAGLSETLLVAVIYWYWKTSDELTWLLVMAGAVALVGILAGLAGFVLNKRHRDVMAVARALWAGMVGILNLIRPKWPGDRSA